MVLNAEQQSLVTALLVYHLWNYVNVYHGDKSSNELEIFEVVWVDGRGGVDLQTVVVFTGIFKKTIHGVQNFMRQQEKPLPVRDTYTQSIILTTAGKYCLYCLSLA